MEPTEPAQAKKTEDTFIPADLEHELSTGERFSRDLDRINSVIVGMLKNPSTDPSDLRQAWSVREILTEEFIDSLEPTPDNPNLKSRVQFDIMVDKAMLFEAAGNNVRYLEDLDTAEAFASNSNLYEVTNSIGEELDDKIQELGSTPEELILKLRGVIEFSDRYYLRKLLAEGADYEDLIDNIFRIILEEGGDPDEVLKQFGVT